MLGDLITEDVKVEFQHNHPEYITSDDLSWLDDIIFDVTGAVSDIKTTAADRLSVEFTAFPGSACDAVRRGKARFPCGCESRSTIVASVGSSLSGSWR